MLLDIIIPVLVGAGAVSIPLIFKIRKAVTLAKTCGRFLNSLRMPNADIERHAQEDPAALKQLLPILNQMRRRENKVDHQDR